MPPSLIVFFSCATPQVNQPAALLYNGVVMVLGGWGFAASFAEVPLGDLFMNFCHGWGKEFNAKGDLLSGCVTGYAKQTLYNED